MPESNLGERMLHHIGRLPFMYYCIFQPRLAGTLVCKLYGKMKSNDGDRNVNPLRLSHLSHKVKKNKEVQLFTESSEWEASRR